ncbi:MAG: hypothetical protein CSB06_01485 [Bacteroidia bacterium]|nr:MAG: hypothetical protein CSB06_01485 [Bacteroidia bacterium]
MSVHREFYEWLSSFLTEHNIPISRKDEVAFISYSNYESEETLKESLQFIVYEDFWRRKNEITRSRIRNFFHLNQRIYARKCRVKKIDTPTSDKFLNDNHLYGSCKAKVKYGLFYREELCVVATFAAQRRFKDNRRSAELLRFCNKNHFTVVGGLSKLLNAYIADYKPDNIMTYLIDSNRENNAFRKIGFEDTGETKTVRFFINQDTHQRIAQHIAEKNPRLPDTLPQSVSTTVVSIKMTKNIHYSKKVKEKQEKQTIDKPL